MSEKYPVIPPDERKPLGWLFSPARLHDNHPPQIEEKEDD